jgi:hypothetical protein
MRASAVRAAALETRMVAQQGASQVTRSVAVQQGAMEGTQGGLNLFRSGSFGNNTRAATTGWKSGDRMLYLPKQANPQANWKQNAGRLRQEMRAGAPIFDSYRSPVGGRQIPTGNTPTSFGRFLNAERKLLESRGWNYNRSTGAYHPPEVPEL